MTVEVLPAPVVDTGGQRVGVAGGDLDVASWDAGVERRHDERRSKHVRVDVVEASSCADRADPTVRSSGARQVAGLIVDNLDVMVADLTAGAIVTFARGHLRSGGCRFDQRYSDVAHPLRSGIIKRMWDAPHDHQQIRLGAPPGVTVEIGAGVDPYRDGYDFVDFPISISGPGLAAQTRVRSLEGSNPKSLSRFVRALAEDWKGNNPDSTWEAIEHGLSIEAHRDTVGHVLLTFTLRESITADAWLVRATVQVDAGEQMSNFARDVERLIAGP